MRRFIKFLLGLALGAGAAMLLTPKSGRELREQLISGATNRLLPSPKDTYAPRPAEDAWQAWEAPAATPLEEAEPAGAEETTAEDAAAEALAEEALDDELVGAAMEEAALQEAEEALAAEAVAETAAAEEAVAGAVEEELVAEGVDEAVAAELAEEVAEEAVAEELAEEIVTEAVAEELMAEGVDEALAEKVAEEAVEEAVAEELAEQVAEEAVTEAVAEELAEEEPEAEPQDVDLRPRIEETRAAVEEEIAHPFGADETAGGAVTEDLEGVGPRAEEPIVVDESILVTEELAAEGAVEEAEAVAPVAWETAPAEFAAEEPVVEAAAGETAEAPTSEQVAEVEQEPASAEETAELPVEERPEAEASSLGPASDQAAPGSLAAEEAGRTREGSIDQAEMRRRIEETRARLKAKAFDAMMSGESALLRNDTGEKPVPRGDEAGLEPDVGTTIDESLSQEDY